LGARDEATALTAFPIATMESIVLRTPRLLLRSTTVELAAADLNDPAEFSRLLAADVPEDWPPPLNDNNSKKFTLNYLAENPDVVGWAAWYFLLHRTGGARPRTIGIGGFRGKPTGEGGVEVGYSILPGYQGQGLASEAVSGLVDWAFTHSEVKLVTAQTLPQLRGSIRVLERNGFRYLGEGSEAGIVCYGRQREGL